MEDLARARIVAVPGLGGSPDILRPTLDLVAGTSRVVTLPGFGRPGGERAPEQPRDLARILLDAMGPEPVVLFGHSAGCQVVARAAARAAERVRAVVLVGPTTDPQADTWPVLLGRLARTAVRERPSQLPLLLRAYRRTGPATMVQEMDTARHGRIDHVLATVRAPVLVVRGRHDRISPRRWVDELAAATPDGRSETLTAGAHMVPLTHSTLLAASIAGFLDIPAPPG